MIQATTDLYLMVGACALASAGCIALFSVIVVEVYLWHQRRSVKPKTFEQLQRELRKAKAYIRR